MYGMITNLINSLLIGQNGFVLMEEMEKKDDVSQETKGIERRVVA
jgi:hypothetical protein